MSWQQYVDEQLLGRYNNVGEKALNDAAIIDRNTGAVWAKSANFNITDGETAQLAKSFNDLSLFQASGARIGGEKFMYLSKNESDNGLLSVRVKNPNGGAHMSRTKMGILIGVYRAEGRNVDNAQTWGGDASCAVEAVGDILVTGNM